jgi:sec-independent protein translocase protein TatB
VFGVGPPELVVIGLLFLVVFGPGKVPSMAREVGRLVSASRRYMDELKSELVSEEVKEEVKEARRDVEEVKNELVSGGERDERRRGYPL